MAWLRSAGINRHRLFTKGYGADVPLVDHADPDAGRINRRVEFTVLKLEEVPDSQRMPSEDVLPDQ